MLRRLGILAAALMIAAIAVLATAPPSRAAALAADDEWALLRALNAERWRHGLEPLSMNPSVRHLSRGWSSRQQANGALQHDPDLRREMARADRRWAAIGENVGMARSAGELHAAFMASPTHRANILRADYRYVGVGVVRDGARLWATVRFLGTRTQMPTDTRLRVHRLAGADAIATSVAVSAQRPVGSAAGVVVARVDAFADALTGAPLAAKHGGSVLLSRPTAAPAAVVNEAQRVLRPGGIVYLLGGPAALSPDVEMAFTRRGLVVQRLAGADRYSTALAVASEVNPRPTAVFMVSGEAFPDAVVASAPAAVMGAPILLVPPDPRVMSDTTAWLLVHQPARRIVVGGADVVSPWAGLQNGETERVAGQDRYSTAVAVAERFFPATRWFSLATGLRFADALSGAPESARDGAPILLTAPTPTASTYDYVVDREASWLGVNAFGGTAAVRDGALALLAS